MGMHGANGTLQRVPDAAKSLPALVADLERLVAAPNLYFEAGFCAFVQRLSQAFQAEELRLEEAGIASLKAHQLLHAEVIRLMLHAQARNLAGDYALARKVIRLLPEWFSMNLPGMDWPTHPPPATGQVTSAPKPVRSLA